MKEYLNLWAAFGGGLTAQRDKNGAKHINPNWQGKLEEKETKALGILNMFGLPNN